jgi:GGDEF domain-containing protein
LEKRIYRYIDSPLNIDGNNISIKASIGHAIYSETLSIDTLLELSDNRMYDVKKLHHRV